MYIYPYPQLGVTSDIKLVMLKLISDENSVYTLIWSVFRNDEIYQPILFIYLF